MKKYLNDGAIFTGVFLGEPTKCSLIGEDNGEWITGVGAPLTGVLDTMYSQISNNELMKSNLLKVLRHRKTERPKAESSSVS